jgi:hypothetical protein
MTAEQIYNQNRPTVQAGPSDDGVNIEFIKRGETIWEWYRFMTSLSWQSWGIERRIRNKVHFRNGSVETVYAK